MLLLSALIFLISMDSVRGKPNFIIMLMDDVSITECKSRPSRYRLGMLRTLFVVVLDVAVTAIKE